MFKQISTIQPQRVFSIHSRNHFRMRKKREKILDPSHKEDVPVYKLPAKSRYGTIVYGWGLAEHGGLGHCRDKTMIRTEKLMHKKFKRPFRMVFGEVHKVTDVAAGYGFSAFSVKSNTQWKVYGSGLNTNSQIGYHERKNGSPLEIIHKPVPINLNLKEPFKTKVIGLSAGRAHLVIVTDLEGVFTLGNNAYGQCGRSIIHEEDYKTSRICHQILGAETNEKIVSAECGQDHTLLLTESGRVFSCGWGADGQTGLGHFEAQGRPSRVLGDIETEKIVKLSSKCDCVLALNDKGQVFGWGNSEYSQIFDQGESKQQSNTPIHLKKCEGFGKIVDIAAAGSHCMMLNEAGEVFAWGYGILGLGPSVSHSWSPRLIPPILFGQNEFQPDVKVHKVFCGLHYSGAINNYGHIYMWGKNKSGCLGLVTNNDQYFPLRVYINNIGKKLALGVDHSLALCSPF